MLGVGSIPAEPDASSFSGATFFNAAKVPGSSMSESRSLLRLTESRPESSAALLLVSSPDTSESISSAGKRIMQIIYLLLVLRFTVNTNMNTTVAMNVSLKIVIIYITVSNGCVWQVTYRIPNV